MFERLLREIRYQSLVPFFVSGLLFPARSVFIPGETGPWLRFVLLHCLCACLKPLRGLRNTNSMFPRSFGLNSQSSFSDRPPLITVPLCFKTVRKMGIWDQIAQYLFLKKKDPNTPKSKWVGYMHGINRLSILLFLIAIIIIIVRLLMR